MSMEMKEVEAATQTWVGVTWVEQSESTETTHIKH